MNRNECSAIHRIPFFTSSHGFTFTNSLGRSSVVEDSSLRNPPIVGSFSLRILRGPALDTEHLL